MNEQQPRLLVFSSLFPSDVQPGAGLFVRERLFRVGRELPIVVVAPQAWFPLQGLVRMFRPHWRPMAKRHERMQGFEVHRPWFLSVPWTMKRFDGLFMALSSYFTVRRVVREHKLNLLDAHFGYPDGYAGTLLGRWLGLPVVVTLRGKEERQSRTSSGPPQRRALLAADQLVSVSEALRRFAMAEGVAPDRIVTIGNGVDLSKFTPVDRDEARRSLGVPDDAQVILSVGTLVERKGFHRVIECLPELVKRHPKLLYLIVGGAGPEGDISSRLREQVAAAGVGQHVRFVGPLPPERLRVAYSAADIFALATSYEGWANVFLEAMACGQPVVTTDVGGNAEVVCRDDLGAVVPFGDKNALAAALSAALDREWSRTDIIHYAQQNTWDQRIAQLVVLFRGVLSRFASRG